MNSKNSSLIIFSFLSRKRRIFTCAVRSFSSLLLNAAKVSIPFGQLGRPHKAWWSEETELAVRDRRRARSEAHRSETYHLAYVEASRKASSVISRAKAETWQATCNTLSPRSNFCAVFNLLNTDAGKKGFSRDPEFPDSQSPKDTANIYAFYLRSHFSQQTPRLSRGTKRSFINDLRSDQCSDSTLYSTFCSPFTTKEFTTAISKLSISTTSGPDLIAYLFLTHFPPSAQQHLLSNPNWFWSSNTFPSCWKPATIIPIHKPGKPTDSLASYRAISLTSCISKLFERLVLNRLCYYLVSKKSNLSYPGRLSIW